jgi:opacity protein-like surface antigen
MSNPVFADSGLKDMKKWYLEGNVGYTALSPVDLDHDVVGFAMNRERVSPVGLGANIGYQFNPFIAAELGFNYFFIAQRNTLFFTTPGNKEIRTLTDLNSFTVAAKATLPVNAFLSMYTKLGLAYTNVSLSTKIVAPSGSATHVSAADISPMFGAGFQANLTNELYLQLGWMLIPGKQASCSNTHCTPINRPMINEITAGLGYRFGSLISSAFRAKNHTKKWYIEGNAGYMVLNPVQQDYSTETHRQTLTPFGLGINTGYQFNSFIATEWGFNYFFASQRNTVHNLGTVFQNTLTHMYAFTLAAKTSLPLNSTTSIYTKLGLAYSGVTFAAKRFGSDPLDRAATHTPVGDISPMFGAGLQTDLMSNLYLQLGWMMIPGKQSSCSANNCTPVNRPMINTFMFGLGYRFG